MLTGWRNDRHPRARRASAADRDLGDVTIGLAGVVLGAGDAERIVLEDPQAHTIALFQGAPLVFTHPNLPYVAALGALLQKL